MGKSSRIREVESKVGSDGTIWYKNPWPDRVGNEWIHAGGFIAFMRLASLAFEDIPENAKDAVQGEIDRRMAKLKER